MTCLYNDPVARAQFNAQGVATMGLCPDWDGAVAAYVAADVRAKAQEDFGPISERREERSREASRLARKFGKAWHNHPETADFEKRHRAESLADEEAMLTGYHEPLWEAMRRLAGTSAPSLSAAVFKAAVIDIHEVWNDGALKADCIALIDADFARFAGGAA